MIPWGERLEPRPPVICMPRPSWPFTRCIFQIWLPSLCYKRAQTNTHQTIDYTGWTQIYIMKLKKANKQCNYIGLVKMWHDKKHIIRKPEWIYEVTCKFHSSRVWCLDDIFFYIFKSTQEALSSIFAVQVHIHNTLLIHSLCIRIHRKSCYKSA